jgi:predicted nucleic acid-binding protein
LEAGDEGLARRYESVLLQSVVIIPFDVEPARLYANIRKDRTIRPPDAIQLACAAHARVDLFITNDERLSTKSIPNIQFVSSLQRAFL